MKRNIVLCSHGRLCEGMLDTLELFSLKDENVYAIPFYTGEADGEEALKALTAGFGEEEITLLITDVAFGSVNQTVARLFMGKPGYYVISGMNLALVMELATMEPADIREEAVREHVHEAQSSIAYVPDLFQAASEEDE